MAVKCCGYMFMSATLSRDLGLLETFLDPLKLRILRHSRGKGTVISIEDYFYLSFQIDLLMFAVPKDSFLWLYTLVLFDRTVLLDCA